MFIPIDVLFFICWIITGILCSYKQYRAIYDKDAAAAVSFCAFICGPIWLAGAIIRQTIIEDWK